MVIHRHNGTVAWSGQWAAIRQEVEEAVKDGADLCRANLRWADLCRANLRLAHLRWADLCRANLRGADLRGSDLREADLSGANLREADLSGADLRGANLSGANLHVTDLRGANLREIKKDIYSILVKAKAEVPGLLAALRKGRVDGSTYVGKCACLIGTIANIRGCEPWYMRGIIPNGARPAEVWFSAIRRGDTHADNPVSEITVQWVKEWMKKEGVHA